MRMRRQKYTETLPWVFGGAISQVLRDIPIPLGLGFKMITLRRLAVLGFFLIVTNSQGWAQSVVLGNGNALALYGLTFSVSGCTLNGGGCGSSLELSNVANGRGNIEFEVVSTAGGTPFSRALGAGAGTSTLQFTITATQTSNQPTTLAESATLIDTGTRNIACAPTHTNCAAGTTASASLNFSNITITTNPLTQALTANQPAMQTQTSGVDNATADNAFSFVETISLSTLSATNYNPGGTLQLNTVAVNFRAAPEPASIMIMLSGICGIVAVRRRRSSRPT
jgi:hypothetical protein